MKFDVDYLADLQPVLAHLRRLGLDAEIEHIEEEILAGSTGGEILDRICHALRQLPMDESDRASSDEVALYLSKAHRGFF